MPMVASPAQTAPFSDAYSRLLRDFAAQTAERAADYARPSASIREEIVRCIWFGGHFDADRLTTDDGRRVEVLSPGWWNVEGGPDFARAEVLLEGEGRLTGDVEVHTLASGWYAHGHHAQPRYEDVLLHVVMWNDRGEPTVRSAGGRAVPQVTLSRAVDDDVEELVEALEPDPADAQPAQWSPVHGKWCSQACRDGRLSPDWLGRLLDAAADYRLLSRAAAVGELFENHPREQLLYERLAESLGYKQNRMPFLQLAGLVPLEALRESVPEDAAPAEKSILIEAALLAVGGLLAGKVPDGDQETAAHLTELTQAWRSLEDRLGRACLTPAHWSLAGVRPANHPVRRIAALAQLYGGHLHGGLLNHLLRLVRTAAGSDPRRTGRAVRRALIGAFTGLDHAYWSHRCTFGGRPLARRTALIGEERATAVVVDVLLPFLLAHAQAERDAEVTGLLHALWQDLPRRQDNAVTRRMMQALFADAGQARAVVRSARRQQGLHQIYRDCCRADPPEGGCERCLVYLAHHAGAALAPS